jgi:hypothetical protein
MNSQKDSLGAVVSFLDANRWACKGADAFSEPLRAHCASGFHGSGRVTAKPTLLGIWGYVHVVHDPLGISRLAQE